MVGGKKEVFWRWEGKIMEAAVHAYTPFRALAFPDLLVVPPTPPIAHASEVELHHVNRWGHRIGPIVTEMA